jgi:diguanylate cyclase (GGDEF)-like protein
MKMSKKHTLSGALDSLALLYNRISGRSYRLLHQYILDISQSTSTDAVLEAASKCLKEILNYDMFGFAMKCGNNYDLWVDPGIYEEVLLDIAKQDFPHQQNDFYVHRLGTDREMSCQNNGGLSQEGLISFVILNDVFRAILYVHPRRKMLFQHDQLRIIVRSLGIALENAMRIQQLENIAAIDPLTNCYNRRAFMQHFDISIAFSKRYDRSLSVMMIDIDDFKRINDTCGHGMGDQVLKTASAMIAANVRKSDYLARQGGDEFVLLMPETGLFYATQIAEKLRNRIEAMTVEFRGRTIGVTASFGVAELGKDMSAAALLHEADVLLYAAKDRGKNLVAPMSGPLRSLPRYGPASIVPSYARETAVYPPLV